MCEEEYADVCDSYLSLFLPKKGTELYKKLIETPKINPLDLFPYNVNFEIKLKNGDQNNKVLGTYDIINELNR